MDHILPRANRRERTDNRIWYGLAGAGLLFYGLQRRSLFGGLMALLGTDLIARGTTGKHLPEALGVAPRRQAGPGARIGFQVGIQVRKSICVGVSPDEAYSFMRDFQQFPRFMDHVKNVTIHDDARSHWVAKGPIGTEVAWNANIINDIPGELLAWRSEENSDIDNAGSVRFERAPQDRGTIIRVSLQYMPPAGAIGAVIAKLFGEEPSIQIDSDLKRLKQLLETGEIATTEGQPVGGIRGRRLAKLRERPSELPQNQPTEPTDPQPEQNAPPLARAEGA